MNAIRITILGAGSVRCTPSVIASLANYYGERPLEICLADSDDERLDLFDRLARASFTVANSDHHLESTTDLGEALDAADRVVVQIGANCARKYLRSSRRQGTAELDDRSMIEQAAESLTARISSDAEVLSLLAPEIVLPRTSYRRLDWPEPITDAERIGVPHQVLRWVRGEDSIVELLRKHENSPLRHWLETPEIAIAVQSNPVI